jgi:hypothetical protein
MENSFEPQLESFFGPSIREFLLYAAATTDENEPDEYDSAPETSRNEFSSFDPALPGPSLLEDQELDELMRACASCLDNFDTEPLEKRSCIAASTSNPTPVKRKFGPAKTGEDSAIA